MIESWHESLKIHGWIIGKYVIMPDHVHFFCVNISGAKNLSEFLRDFKKWTGKNIKKISGIDKVWQSEFFDHVLRNKNSYEAKWKYVSLNPVRAELVSKPEEWKYLGTINELL